jgi:hypothetical protein
VSEEEANFECQACGQTCLEICPLPRIGSKEWEWGSYQSDSGRWWSSPKNEYQVDRSKGKWRVVGEGKDGDTDARILATCGDLDTAFRFAELLARRDWRRENRGKKC